MNSRNKTTPRWSLLLGAILSTVVFSACEPDEFEGDFTLSSIQFKTDGKAMIMAKRERDGVILPLPEEIAGCWKLTTGANLVSCVQSCDGTKGFMLAESNPDYEAIYTRASHEAWAPSEAQEASFTPANLKIERDGKTMLLGYKQTPQADFCQGHADTQADSCAVEVVHQLMDSPEERDPLDAYEALLTENAELALSVSNQSAREIQSTLKDIESLRKEFKRVGFKTFDRQGPFYAQNIKNAPGMICQLKSLRAMSVSASALKAPTDSLVQALAQDRDELQSSIEFLKKL